MMPDLAPISRSRTPNARSAGKSWLLLALISAICGFAGLLLEAEILVAASLIWSLMACTRLNRRRVVNEIKTCPMNSARLAAHEIYAWTWNPHSRTFWACAHFHSMIGLRNGTLRHEHDLRALIHPEDLCEHIFPRTPSNPTHLRIKISDGSWVNITLTQCSTPTEDEHVVGTAVSSVQNSDVSDTHAMPLTNDVRRVHDDRLTVSAKENGEENSHSEFITELSHEIRSPLNAILGFTELLHAADANEQKRFIQTIQRNGEHLLRLVNDTLSLSKAEEGKIEFETRVVNPAEILHELRDMFSLEAKHKDLELRFDCDVSTPPQLHLDPTRYRQILVNLISNALRFTSKGFISARLSYDNVNHELLCEIRDSGVGIPENAIDTIFEPFKQARASTSRTHGGTGLGLHISQKLSQRMGGGITVRSRVGFGSSFTVRVHSPSTTLLPSPQIIEQDLNCIDGLVVLLADDGADNRRLLSHLLTNAGAHVLEATNGQEALQAIRLQSASPRSIDLVILDMHMPVLDGYQTARQLRMEGCETPILALTAKSLPRDREACLESGCDHYLAKPIQTKKFLNEISALIHQQTPKQRAG